MYKLNIDKDFYVKSFEEDLSLKTVVDEKKVVSQTMPEIIESAIIKPNTFSFKQEKRLSTTLLQKNYLQTYREQGIIFQTNENPDYILPFDLSVLLQLSNEDIVVQYNEIKEKLHLYYNTPLIDGSEQFRFHDPKKMFAEIPTPEAALEIVNRYRTLKGFEALGQEKMKLFQYDEAVFTNPVKLTMVGLFGKIEGIKKLGEEYHLPYFESAQTFFEKIEKLRQEKAENQSVKDEPTAAQQKTLRK